ncbi:hypothetical protein BDY19DRAFT_212877 [Irpex rosettiformis]|uniref:Uncharacterized protein n=1 Tax=Irpex rosettiformis TaxID=378272 RepID=A0ACB8U1C0_9APHY|nr:hypothetical protein BDY19DRAFT_212877 [Irpex rosettiformis]
MLISHNIPMHCHRRISSLSSYAPRRVRNSSSARQPPVYAHVGRQIPTARGNAISAVKALLFSMTVDVRSDSFATKFVFDRNGRQSSFSMLHDGRAGLRVFTRLEPPHALPAAPAADQDSGNLVFPTWRASLARRYQKSTFVMHECHASPLCLYQPRRPQVLSKLDCWFRKTYGALPPTA